MKTVLHIITALNNGGAEAALYRLCSRDRTAIHHVVSLMDHGKYGSMLEEAGVPVTTLSLPRGRVTIAGLWQLWRFIRRLKPDVIQTWMYHANLIGGLAGHLAGHRNISWGIHHASLSRGETRRSTIWVARICAWLSSRIPKRIICCAERSRLVHETLGYNSERMRVITNGYDVSVFRPDKRAGRAIRRELLLDSSTPLIGFVARFDPIKDHETLFAALSILKHHENSPSCILVGTGMNRANSSLVERIAFYGLAERVHLLGERRDIPAIMNALDLHVLSSVSEAFPNVLAEAMACGTPCVSTDVGDAASIIATTGLVVPVGSPEELANAIRELLIERHKPIWNVRKNAALHVIRERYTVERMIQTYHDTWFEE